MSKQLLLRLFFEYRQVFLYIGLAILGLVIMKAVLYFSSPKPAPAPTPDTRYELQR